MAILAFFGKSIQKPYFGPFGDFWEFGPFLFGAVCRLLGGQKGIQKKHPAQKDLNRTIWHLPDSTLPHKYFCGSKTGKFWRKKGQKRGILGEWGPWSAQKVTLKPRECPKTTQEQKLDRFDHSDPTSFSDPRFEIFGSGLPGNCPFFLTVAFKPKMAIWRVAQLPQNRLIWAEILFGAFRGQDRSLT